MKITAIRLRGKLFDDRKIQAQVDTGLDKAAVALTADFGKTVSTWKDKPTFETHKIRGGRVVSAHNRIYFFISEGTRVRYATMTPNFKAKTAPGRLQAGAGAGGVLFISKKRPRPGIKARKFDKQLIKIWKDKLQGYIQKEIKQ
jgi:hypothetical protein